MFYQACLQMKKMLGQVEKWLDQAESFAKEKSFDANLFLSFRLAPNQFPLVRQLQTACDTAKLSASRLSGKEAPQHEDTEQTVEQLRARVRSVIEYLNGFSAKDFENSAQCLVTQARWEGQVMTGEDYLLEYAQPNFFFHLSHTYAILRHNGVELGKRDYLGALDKRAP